MIKILFLDLQEVDSLHGFTRELSPPEKHPGNPLLTNTEPWEVAGMQLYGSVIKAPGRPFQLWYHTNTDSHSYLCYAESDDGLTWRKPLFDLFPWDGQPTNIAFDRPHGPAVIYDHAEPREDWRYKLVVGSPPSNCICAYRSADGIHWVPIRRGPVVGTNPDCPIGFLRATDGRYVMYHRVWGHGRRVFRSESWDFTHWSGEPRMVVEPDAGDGPQVEFYGMGAAVYGGYELGTLWMYHTEAGDDVHHMRGVQEAELTYARSGYAWHRAAQGTPFIPHGSEGTWECGNLQVASQPVYLEDEIRYYYAGATLRHFRGWVHTPQRGGLGLATMKPDRFVALRAGVSPAELVTSVFPLPSDRILLNASTQDGGQVRVALLHAEGGVVEGMGLDDCVPFTGDAVAHEVRWRAASGNQSSEAAPAPGDLVRLAVRAQHASLFSLAVPAPGETPEYHRFMEANPQRNHLPLPRR